MVNQVNDKAWTPIGGSNPAGAAPQQAASVRQAAGPAVKLELSETTRTGIKAGASLDDLASAELVREIRERVESGRFTIDYEKLGQAMLQDVVAQAIVRRD